MKRVLPVLAAGFVLSAASAEDPAITLSTVHRIYIESLGSTPEAIMLRDMVISSIASSGVLSVTENASHAEATLRGSADDKIFVEQHSFTDNLSLGLRSGSSNSQSSKYDRSAQSKTGGLTTGQNESMQETERRHEASASVRLVTRDGDVIWSTTQESLGAKFRSSSADVADKIYRKLAQDLQNSRSTASAAMHAGMPSR